jgi:hypothetical protein
MSVRDLLRHASGPYDGMCLLPDESAIRLRLCFPPAREARSSRRERASAA